MHCIHEWGEPIRVGTHGVYWHCRRCEEIRSIMDDKPTPGTFMAATEDFTNAVRNLGLTILAALPGPLRRLIDRQ